MTSTFTTARDKKREGAAVAPSRSIDAAAG